ncbi:MAG: hypothetical protein M5U34_48025 [Chloroflexi bacterium]|nr:hypothetical protein [Chloroflexota bacterium]
MALLRGELRKYFVTLLVVGSTAVGHRRRDHVPNRHPHHRLVRDEDDIRAVLTGLAGRDQLRGMLARLQEKEEVLLLGWGG